MPENYEIASISIGSSLDLSGFYKDIESLQKRLKQNPLTEIVPKVNDSQLTALNKHFDLKVKHAKEVNAFFKQNPIVVSVDFSQLDELERRLGNIRKQSRSATINFTGGISASGGTGGGSANNKALAEEIGRSVARNVRGGSVGGAVSKVASIPLKIASQAIGSVGEGLVFGITQEVTRNLGKGLTDAIESSLSDVVGSTELLGGRLGLSVAKSLASAIGKSLPSGVQDVVKDVISDALGADNIVREGLSQRSKISKDQQRKNQFAQGQALSERRDLLRQRLGTQNDLAITSSRIDETQSLIGRASDVQGRIQKLRQDAVNAGESIEKIGQFDQLIVAIGRELEGYIESLRDLTEQKGLLDNELKSLDKQIEATKKQVALIKPKEQPDFYKRAVNQVAGKDVSASQIPDLVVADAKLKAQGARAVYGVESNTVQVTQDLYDAIEKGQLTKDQMEDLLHELQHAVDFAFGSEKGINARRSGRILSSPVQATTEELKQITPLINQYSPEERQAEINAEILGRRNAAKLFGSQQRQTAMQTFENQFGFGGNNAQKLANQSIAKVRSQIASLTNIANSVGLEIGDQLDKFWDQTKAVQSRIENLSKEILSGDNTAEDIDRIGKDLLEQLQGLEQLEKLFDRFRMLAVQQARTKQGQVNPQQGQASLKSSNVVPLKKQEQTQAQPDVLEVSANVVSVGDSVTREIIDEAKKLGKQIKSDYSEFKESVKQKNRELAKAQAKALIEISNAYIDEIDQTITELKSGNFDTKFHNVIGANLQSVKGQISRKRNLAQQFIDRNEPELTAAELEAKAKQADSGELESQRLRVPRSLQDFKQATQNATKALNQFVAKQYSIDPQETISETISEALKTPEAQAQIKDLAVNAGGFVASSLAGQSGDVAGLAADLIGALATRQAIEVGSAGIQGFAALKDDPTFKAANALKKFAAIVDQINQKITSEQFGKEQSEALFGDLTGFGVGNLVATLGQGTGIPMRGAMAAMATVPQLQALRNRINQNATGGGDELESARLLELGKLKGGKSIDPDTKKFLESINKLIDEAIKSADEFDQAFNVVNKQTQKQFDESAKAAQQAAESFLKTGDAAEESQDGLSNLVGIVGKITTGFLLFQGLTFISPLLIEIAKSSLDVALEFDRFNRTLEFTLGSSDAAKAKFEELSQSAQTLGFDLRQAVEGYSQLSAATNETPLEGFATDQIAGAINQASTVSGLSAEQQQRAYLAVSQIAGKGTVQAEELRGQLSEVGGVFAGSFNIAARSLGVTTAELNKMLQAGQVLSEEFLPKFAQQLAAETDGSVAGAADSAQGAINRFNNSIFVTQSALGKALQPGQIAIFNTLAGVLSGLNNNIDIVIKGLTTLAGVAGLTLLNALRAILPAIQSFLVNLGIIPASATAARSALLALGGSIAATAAKFALVYAAIEVGTSIYQTFTDQTGELGEAADQSRRYLDELNKALDETASKDLSNLNSTGNVKLFNRLFDFLAQPGSGARNQQEDIQSSQINERVSAIVEGNRGAILEVVKLLNEGEDGAIETIKKIDSQIEDLQGRQRAIKVLDPGNTEELEQLKEQEAALQKQREDAVKTRARAERSFQGQIDRTEKAIQSIQSLYDQGYITQSQYESLTSNLTNELDVLTDRQKEFNDALSDTADTLEQIGRRIDGIIAGYEGAKELIGLQRNAGRVARSNAQASGVLTTGQAQAVGDAQNIQAIQQNINALNNAVSQLSATIKGTELGNTVARLGVTPSELTAPQIENLQKQFEGNPKEQAALRALLQIRQYQVETSGLEADLSEAQNSVQQSLNETSREIKDFYRSITRSTEDIAQTVEELNLDRELMNAQTELKKLQSGFDSQFGDIVGEYGKLLDLMYAPQRTLLQTQRDILGLSRQSQDLNQQASNLQRSAYSGAGGYGLPAVPGMGSGTAANSGTVPFQGVIVTSAVDASGEPGLDYVVSDGERGANFGALAAGQVIETVTDQNWESHLEAGDTERGYGNRVIVRTIDEMTGQFVDMLYAHLDSVAVQVGQEVGVGTILGTQGRTGSTTGAHVSVDFYDQDSNTASAAALAMRDRIASTLANNPDALNQMIQTMPQAPAMAQTTQPGGVGAGLMQSGASLYDLAIQAVTPHLQQSEGFVPTTYYDSGGVATIGYGETSPDVVARGSITEEEAVQLMQERLRRDFLPVIIDQIGEDVANSLNPNQLGALLSFGYNAGSLSPSLVDAVRSGSGVNDAFFSWMSDGINPNILEGRRASELELFNTPYSGVPGAMPIGNGNNFAASPYGIPSADMGLINAGTSQAQQAIESNRQALLQQAQASLASNREETRIQLETIEQTLQNDVDQVEELGRASQQRYEDAILRSFGDSSLGQMLTDTISAGRESSDQIRQLDSDIQDTEAYISQLQKLRDQITALPEDAQQRSLLPNLDDSITTFTEQLNNLQGAYDREAQIYADQNAEIARQYQEENDNRQRLLDRQREDLQIQAQLAGVQNPEIRSILEGRQENLSILRQLEDDLNAADSEIENTINGINRLKAEIDSLKGEGADTTDLENALSLAEDSLQLQQQTRAAIEENGQLQFDITRQQQQQSLNEFYNTQRSSLTDAQVTSLQNRGDVFGANNLQRNQALGAEQSRFSDEMNSISALEQQGNFNPAVIAAMREQAELLNQVNLENIRSQFKDLGDTLGDTTSGAFQGFLTSIPDVIAGTKSIGDAFGEMANMIIDQLAQMASQWIVSQLFGGFFEPASGKPGGMMKSPLTAGIGGMGSGSGGGGGMGGVGGIFNLLGGLVGGGGGAASGVFGVLGGLLGFADGGMIPGAYNGKVDRTLALVTPGEFVVNRAAAQQFRPMLEQINSLPRFANGGMVGAGDLGAMPTYKMSRSDSEYSSNRQTLDLKTEVINSVEYVSVDQLKQAMAQASRKGAEQGHKMTIESFQNKPSVRRSVGI